MVEIDIVLNSAEKSLLDTLGTLKNVEGQRYIFTPAGNTRLPELMAFMERESQVADSENDHQGLNRMWRQTHSTILEKLRSATVIVEL
jgi:hypothetical protein